MYRIPIAQPEIAEEELRNVTEAVKSGWVSSKGVFIEEFEKNFSGYVNVKHGVSTSSGTTALHLALVALGIGKKDKVLIPSLTFVAVANAVSYTGAQPVFIDSDRQYWCIDPSSIEDKIDSRTKAIIAVHLYGHPCDMDEIMGIAHDHKLDVIEDCAEAHGAEYKGKKVGSIGTVGCFSFYGNKIITTGEGGMCLTNDEDVADRMRILRDHGMSPHKKYWHEAIGFNYRMTNLQAALGVAQLGKIGSLINNKRGIAAEYTRLIEKELPEVTLPPEMPWAKTVCWLYSVLVEKDLRQKIVNRLEKEGVESRPFFHPIHKLPPYKRNSMLPIAEELSKKGLSLPSGYQISRSQIEGIVESIRANYVH